MKTQIEKVNLIETAVQDEREGVNRLSIKVDIKFPILYFYFRFEILKSRSIQ